MSLNGRSWISSKRTPITDLPSSYRRFGLGTITPQGRPSNVEAQGQGPQGLGSSSATPAD